MDDYLDEIANCPALFVTDSYYNVPDIDAVRQ